LSSVHNLLFRGYTGSPFDEIFAVWLKKQQLLPLNDADLKNVRALHREGLPVPKTTLVNVAPD
jgi:hypothetical protein